MSETRTPSAGGTQTVKIIPERDVCRLVMRSKLPAAEAFEEWVVGTVLPSVRKHGGYVTGQETEEDPAVIMAGAPARPPSQATLLQRKTAVLRIGRLAPADHHMSGTVTAPRGPRTACRHGPLTAG